MAIVSSKQKILPLKNKNATIKIAVERMMENDINAELWMLISRELISSRNSMTLWSESSAEKNGKKRTFLFTRPQVNDFLKLKILF